MAITWRAILAARETSGLIIANDVDSSQYLEIFGSNGTRVDHGAGYGASGQYPAHTGATTGELAAVNGSTKVCWLIKIHTPATSIPNTGELLFEIGKREEPLADMRLGLWLNGEGTSLRFRANGADVVVDEGTVLEPDTSYVIAGLWDSENETASLRALMLVDAALTGVTNAITQGTAITYTGGAPGTTDELKAGVPFGRVAGWLHYLAIGTWTGTGAETLASLQTASVNVALDDDLEGPPEGEGGGGGDFAELAGEFTSSSSFTAALSSAVELAGEFTSSSEYTAALTGSSALSGAFTGSSEYTAALTGSSALAATFVGSATASAALGLVAELGGAFTGASSFGGALVGSAALAATFAGAATFTADLRLGAFAELGASFTGASSFSGALTGSSALSGAFTGSSSFSANLALTGTVALAAEFSGVATFSADLRIGSTVELAGEFTSSSSFSANLRGSSALVGVASGSSSFTGALTGSSSLATTFAGSSEYTANLHLTGFVALAGSFVGVATFAARLAEPVVRPIIASRLVDRHTSASALRSRYACASRVI